MTSKISSLEAKLHGQAEITKYTFHFADSMALKCAVELRIADIIHSHPHPITLSQIASSIDSSSPSLNINSLHRIMRMLVRMKIFTSNTTKLSSDDDGSSEDQTLYGMTPSSEWILHDGELSLVPLILLQTHPLMMSSWHYLSACVKEGGVGFKKAHGHELFELASINPEFNKLFNDAMRCSSKTMLGALLSTYSDGFISIGSLVDVGGGTGQCIAEIVKGFPHIKGINFDLPHVLADAPEYNGVSHVAGDMFNDVIPTAGAIFLKHIFHDWGDDYCIKLLKNCRRSITGTNGKIIIVDTILKEESERPYNADVILDLLMMAEHPGGKERTEFEWKKLLNEGGFSSYKIIELPSVVSIIEAYP